MLFGEILFYLFIFLGIRVKNYNNYMHIILLYIITLNIFIHSINGSLYTKIAKAMCKCCLYENTLYIYSFDVSKWSRYG